MWQERWEKLASLLKLSAPNEEALGLALDRWTDSHRNLTGRRAQSAILDVEAVKFGNKDLVVHGALTKGQFGTIHVVQCRLNKAIYVRKTVAKTAAVRFHQQCSVQAERDILLRASKSQTVWVPHLLCAFQTPSDLNFVMDYAEGGSLEDALNSAPLGRLEEKDLKWWIPQAVAAITWCHSQDFVHRDVKPQNFVITATSHLKLIDFGSAAPLQPPDAETHIQYVLKRYCLLPCGTVDYIAPEILDMYEAALVALDLEESLKEEEGYGKEVDWWSLGAMMFELTTGQAPFFADDISQTYLKIMNHRDHTLSFSAATDCSKSLCRLIESFLCPNDQRLGRNHDEDVKQHVWFENVQWSVLHLRSPPADLILPDTSHAGLQPASETFIGDSSGLEPNATASGIGLHFSQFFQSSLGMSQASVPEPPTPDVYNADRDDKLSAFIGFSWGPAENAFTGPAKALASSAFAPGSRRSSLQVPASPFTGGRPAGILKRPLLAHQHHLSEPTSSLPTFSTPARPSLLAHHYPTTIPRTGTTRRVRPVSDHEALQQMMMEVGKSARKKVLESGKKPRSSGKGLPSLALGMPSVAFAPLPPLNLALRQEPEGHAMPSDTAEHSAQRGARPKDVAPALRVAVLSNPSLAQSTASDSTAPPSPSPRPGSAMSRRSATPALTSTFKSLSTTLSTPNTSRAPHTSNRTPVFTYEGHSSSQLLDRKERSLVTRAAPKSEIVLVEPAPRTQRGEIVPNNARASPRPDDVPSDQKIDELEVRVLKTLRMLIRMEQALKNLE